MTGPYPAQQTPGTDRSTLWGVLGIVLGLLCCGLFGFVFGFLSIRDAKRFGRSPVLGYVAVAVGLVNLIGSLILRSTGYYPYWR